MTPSFDALRDASSLTEARAAFGDFLGLDAPVPRRRAQPGLRRSVLSPHPAPRPQPAGDASKPPGPAGQRRLRGRRAIARAEPAPSTPAAPIAFSNGQLAAKAGKALFDWAKTGFAVLDQDAFEARFSACERCDRLSEPPENLAYALTRTKRSDPRVCGACGCTAARKARLASEQCPLTDPDNPALTRWGEPGAADGGAVGGNDGPARRVMAVLRTGRGW